MAWGSGRRYSLRPLAAQYLGLFEHGLGRLLLLIWRVAVAAEDAFDHDANPRPHVFPQGPINGDAVAHGADELLGDGAE